MVSMDDQDLDQPLQIYISEDKDIIIINEDILVQKTAKEAPETEQKAGNEEAQEQDQVEVGQVPGHTPEGLAMKHLQH